MTVLFTLKVGNRPYTHTVSLNYNKIHLCSIHYCGKKTRVGRQTTENLKIIKPNNELFLECKQVATGKGASGQYQFGNNLKKKIFELSMCGEALFHPSHL